MPTYNPNDFYPATGQRVKSDGTTVNEADGINLDGSQKVQLTGSKVSEGISDFCLNQQVILLASQARTSTIISPSQINYNARGVHLAVNVTVASGTGGLVVKIIGFDPINSNYYNLNPSPTAITSTGTYIFELYPGATGGTTAGNQEVVQRTSGALPRIWGVRVFHNDATSYTYSVGYAQIL